MSSPLSSLGKNKKTPLYLPEMTSPTPPSREPEKSSRLQFNSGYSYNPPISSLSSHNITDNTLPTLRRNSIETPRINAVPFKTKIDDSDLIDEVTTQMAVNNLRRNVPSVAKSSAPNDMELMQIMMSKIKETEKRCAIFEKECREKDKKIQILEEKLKLYQKVQAESKDQVVEDLEHKNYDLMNQISEMEAFLADYGLRWIGNKSDSINETIETKTTTTRDLNNFKIDYDLMIKNIEELNSLTDSTETKIVEFNDNKVKFEHSESIKLTLYSNGIALYNGPFRSFDQSITKKFCVDIMDGYFPSEFQEKYPDGVRFDVVDKRDIFFKEEKNSVFKSKGYRLGSARGDSIENENLDKFTNTHEFGSNEDQFDKKIEKQILENPITIGQFLNKLPNKIVKNGKLIDIRSDLSDLLNESESKSSNVNSNQIDIKNLNDVETSTKTNDDDNSSKITTLKIKSLSSNDGAFIVKMKYTDTIQNLKDHIKSLKKFKLGLKDFDIASMFPRKIFDKTKMTLEECELVPNSNIILIPKKK